MTNDASQRSTHFPPFHPGKRDHIRLSVSSAATYAASPDENFPFKNSKREAQPLAAGCQQLASASPVRVPSSRPYHYAPYRLRETSRRFPAFQLGKRKANRLSHCAEITCVADRA